MKRTCIQSVEFQYTRDTKGRFAPGLLAPIESRFWSKVKTPLGIGECWEWLGIKDAHGYGKFNIHNQMKMAHRVSYEMMLGTIPDGMELDHLCRNRGCVNPHHVEPVTHAENVLRGDSPQAINTRKTHCPKGHPLEGSNLEQYAVKIGLRRCRTCKREHDRRYRNSLKAISMALDGQPIYVPSGKRKKESRR